MRNILAVNRPSSLHMRYANKSITIIQKCFSKRHGRQQTLYACMYIILLTLSSHTKQTKQNQTTGYKKLMRKLHTLEKKYILRDKKNE